MLRELQLTNFRNYAAVRLVPAAAVTVLTGPNGSGKTNLLEAISLLGPGRGLRGARLAELPRRDGPGTWAVSARLRAAGGAAGRSAAGSGPGEAGAAGRGPAGRPGADLSGAELGATELGATELGATELGTGIEVAGMQRRRFRLNGEEPRSQGDVAELFAATWLTPQMDGLFQESASGRRRFLDRLVWALEPGHAREASAYEAAMAERNRLLARGRADPAWLAGLEASMARHGVALAAARRALAARVNAPSGPGGQRRPGAGPAGAAIEGFPRVVLRVVDPIGARLDEAPALAVEIWLREALAARRREDAAAGGAGVGAHRADMALSEAQTGMSAAQASTGEQRALLTSLVLAHAALIAEARGAPPVLLLDEAAVHLDEARRAALFEALASGPGQVFLTGTDVASFSALAGRASFLRVVSGGIG